MRRKSSLAIVVAISSALTVYSQVNEAPDPANQKGLAQSAYYGEVVYKSGKTFQYNWLRTSGIGIERIPYAKVLACHERDADKLAQFDVRKVSRIDIISEQKGFDLCGNSLPPERDYANSNVWVYKARIAFRDGEVWNNIYVYGPAWIWKRCADKTACDSLNSLLLSTSVSLGGVADNASGVVGMLIGAQSITINVR